MKRIFLKLLPKQSLSYSAILVFTLLGCASNKKKNKQPIILSNSNQNSTGTQRSTSEITSLNILDLDDHGYISSNSTQTRLLSNAKNSLEQLDSIVIETRISPVADRIVENYKNSDNKEPNGHCLTVSKNRFEEAYKQIYGHTFYEDLPESMASKFYTPKQVFNLLYVSASDTRAGWRSLPEEYRGKGNAGAIAYAGMGDLVDTSGIWSGQLRPGALLQVWRFKDDFEKVVQGVNVKKLDPYGHSFIFISYVRNEKNEIIGLKIADQGFQSYRPLIPRDYEVWWAVNLRV